MSGRAARRLFPAAALAIACVAPAVAIAACVRHADVRDDPDGGGITDPTPELDADIETIDSGLGTDAFPTCKDRPAGDCAGTIDFPCGFFDWATKTAESCQTATGCKTNGTLEATMGADGCVTAIAMDEPNQDMIDCLVAEFGTYQCPCDAEEQVTYYFGVGNTGVCPE